ncbi:gp16 family protein [Sphingomonas sp. CCH19-C6]|uniref:gp16 family protein n=3 Tax=Sphingomonas TaxID=13687 RepID=UPI00082B42DA|nr:regulatory protein GemA [Sphingomonas sp. CCH19-C6]
MNPFAKQARFDTGSQRRRSMIAKIHVAQKEMGLAEDDYRAVLIRVTGHQSAAMMTDAQLEDVIAEFKRLGWKAKPANGGPRPADSRTANKARAMWISLHHLGAIHNPGEPALEAFAKRQLGVERMQWANESLMYRLIEALKAIAERHGWSQSVEGVSPQARRIVLKRRLVQAILGKLWQADLVPLNWDVNRAAYELAGVEVDLLMATESELDLVAKSLGRTLRQPARPISPDEVIR